MKTDDPHPTCDGFSSRARLDDLLQRLAALLPSLPGFRTLSLFGSLAEGRADGYSDIDLIVTTDDLDAAREQLLGTLEEIGPVEFCWVLPLRPDEWNPMIVFATEGYYHRLELGLTATSAKERTIPEEQTTRLVSERVPRPPVTLRESRAYAPPDGSVGSFLLGELLGGGIKYVKARRRGQPMTCYRYAVAAADRCLSAWYAQLSGKGALGRRLSTDEYKALDALAAERGSAFLATLDFSTPQAMDRAVRAVLDRLVQHCDAIAQARGESLPAEVFQRMLQFVDRELEADATSAPPSRRA